MKNSIFQIFTYPLLQVILYSFIIVGSVSFYGPLIQMHALGAIGFQLAGIAGIVGIFLGLLSCIKRFAKLQLLGTLMMVGALIPHLRYEIHQVPQVTLIDTVSIVLIVLFSIVSILVLARFFFNPSKQS